MKIFFNYITSWLFDFNTYIDLMTDIRTTSAAVILVGGVGRFLGFTNPEYVIIVSSITWVSCSLVLKDLNRRKK